MDTSVKEKKTVFLSYRREVSMWMARAIFHHLRAQGYDVFMNMDNLDIETRDFEKVMRREITAREHFLVILTPGALQPCMDRKDWFRREIQYALRQGRTIVPILAHRFNFAEADSYLRGKLAHLKDYVPITIYHEFFEATMQKLYEHLADLPVTGKIKAAPRKQRLLISQAIEKYVELHPNSSAIENLKAEQHFNRGVVAYEMTDYAIAIQQYDEALRLHESYVEVLTERGNAYYHRGNFLNAIRDYDRAMKLNASYVPAYMGLGWIRYQQHSYESALENFNRALELDPGEQNRVVICHNRGMVRVMLQDYEGAIADFDVAIDNGYSDLEWSYNNRGYAKENLNDFQGALEDYEAALKINPENKLARENRDRIIERVE